MSPPQKQLAREQLQGVVLRPPVEQRARLVLARLLAEAGEGQQAKALLQDLLSEVPSHAQAQWQFQQLLKTEEEDNFGADAMAQELIAPGADVEALAIAGDEPVAQTGESDSAYSVGDLLAKAD